MNWSGVESNNNIFDYLRTYRLQKKQIYQIKFCTAFDKDYSVNLLRFSKLNF